MKMMIEYLEGYSSSYAVIQSSHGIIFAIGSKRSGLAVYSKNSKSFHFYHANNVDIVLDNDEEVYEEVDLETFCRDLAS